MKNNLFFNCCVLFLTVCLAMSTGLFGGTTGKISGKVVDKTTGEKLIGANVMIEGTNLGTSSTLQGDYFIINIPPGIYQIKASYMGYTSNIQTEVLVLVDKTTPIDFQLEPTVLKGEQVSVTAYKPGQVEIDLTATKTSYRIDQVVENAGVNNLSDVLELQADVVDDHFRGGRVGESAYFIGGSSINDPLSSQRMFDPMVIALDQVEVLTSGFSPEYGNAQSGVINMTPKEGGSKWQTHLEFSGNAPYYKQFDGSPYDPNKNMTFWEIGANPTQPLAFMDPEYWNLQDASRQGQPYWKDNGLNIPTNRKMTRQDTVWVENFTVQEARARLSLVGLDYAHRNIDPRVDFSVGGPLAKNVKLFVAGRYQTEMAQAPVPRPNLERQVMGNLVWQPTMSDKLRLSYNNIFRYTELRDWSGFSKNQHFQLDISVSKQQQRTHQAGLYWNHVFNPSTFMELTAQMLYGKDEIRADSQHDDVYYKEAMRNNHPLDSSEWSAGFGDEGMNTNTQVFHETYTYGLDGSITSQLNRYNLLKGGVQLSSYDIHVNDDYNRETKSGSAATQYRKYPYEGGLYLQDKLEFEGLIANFGARFDFYQFNGDYYTNIYSPYKNPNYDPTKDAYIDRGPYYDITKALVAESKLYSRFQPRIGVSFPLSESSVFHLNYGTFTQRPPFEVAYYDLFVRGGNVERLHNPNLQPENTQSYDVGLVHAFPYGIKLDVSAYYKNVKNLIEEAVYFDSQQNYYTTYANRDYANINGFHFNLEKEAGFFRSYIKYTYQSATGKSSNTSDAPVVYFEQPPVGQLSVVLPDPKDIYMDYDRTHRVIANARFFTPIQFGPRVFDHALFGNMIFSFTYTYMSGRPFTWDPNGLGLRMNERSPNEQELRCKIQKSIKFGDSSLKLYLEGFNLLNNVVWDYDEVFDPTGERIVFYEKDPSKKNYYVSETEDVYMKFLWSLYKNQPRHFRFGLIWEF
jgi:outer membrane receptor protein involved in Fe transport